MYLKNNKICIYCPAPSAEEALWWGDFYLSLGLKKEFERAKFSTEIKLYNNWTEETDALYTITIRGIRRNIIMKEKINIMWNISHPYEVTNDEYNEYDLVLVASEPYAKKIKKNIKCKVVPLLQCTDTDIFKKVNTKTENDIIFVGNTRGVFRDSVKYSIELNLKNLKVWGKGWGKFIENGYIKGNYYPNNELNLLYNSSKIILNDHWEDMKKEGFISNRVFDGFAAGSFVFSDNVFGINDIFNGILTYDRNESFRNNIKLLLNDNNYRINKTKEIRKKILLYHTYKNRVAKILTLLKEIKK